MQRIELWFLKRFPILWQHQVWIKTRMFLLCIGRLPMYSGEPIGFWFGIPRRMPIENLDRMPTAVVIQRQTGRFAPKPYVHQFAWMRYDARYRTKWQEWFGTFKDEHSS